MITALVQAFRGLTDTMRKTLTWERGTEMTRLAEFTWATGIPVYFCDAYCPWQRGSNENTNGLLRQYFPKKTDLPLQTEAQALKVAAKINSRPPARSLTGRLHSRSSQPRRLE